MMYLWVKEFDQRALHRATQWRPKGKRARRMRAEG
jgi:hypothetical protein